MKIEIQDVDNCTKKISLVIPLQEFQAKIEEQLKRVAQSVQLKGFRKGKVPKNIIEKQYGAEVKRETLTQLISEKMTEVIQEKGLRAVSPPSLLDVQAEEGTDISVSAQVEVIPEIEIQDYSGVELPMETYKVSDKEMDDVVEYYRQRAAKNIPVTDRGVEKEDVIKIDFEGTINGKPFQGGESKDYVFQVGKGNALAGFEDGVKGMKVGEEKDVSVSFPEDFKVEALKGQTAAFHISLKEVFARDVPELNDDFARTADPNKNYESLLDMKMKIRGELEEYERKEARKRCRKLLTEKLAEMNSQDVPEALIQEQIRFMILEAEKKAHPQGEHRHETDPDRETPISTEDDAKYREQSIKLLQQELVVGKLSEDLKIEVTEADLDQELQNFSQMAGMSSPAALKQEWRKSGNLDRLMGRLKRERTLDAVLEKISLKEEMVDRPEIIHDN